LRTVTAIEPTPWELCAAYWARGEEEKIGFIRYDSLAMLLNLTNVRYGSKMVIVDACGGIVLGSCLFRMGGGGGILSVRLTATSNDAARWVAAPKEAAKLTSISIHKLVAGLSKSGGGSYLRKGWREKTSTRGRARHWTSDTTG
jgi:hypothetical protein